MSNLGYRRHCNVDSKTWKPMRKSLNVKKFSLEGCQASLEVCFVSLVCICVCGEMFVPGGKGRLQAKRWETHHYQCDVTSYISVFRNGAHFCCSLSSHKNGNANGLAGPVITFYINTVSQKRVRHVCNDIRRLGKVKSFKSRMNPHYRVAVMSAQCVRL